MRNLTVQELDYVAGGSSNLIAEREEQPPIVVTGQRYTPPPVDYSYLTYYNNTNTYQPSPSYSESSGGSGGDGDGDQDVYSEDEQAVIENTVKATKAVEAKLAFFEDMAKKFGPDKTIDLGGDVMKVSDVIKSMKGMLGALGTGISLADLILNPSWDKAFGIAFGVAAGALVGTLGGPAIAVVAAGALAGYVVENHGAWLLEVAATNTGAYATFAQEQYNAYMQSIGQQATLPTENYNSQYQWEYDTIRGWFGQPAQYNEYNNRGYHEINDRDYHLR